MPAEVNIGLVGTGFIASNLAREILRRDGFRVSSVLTRRTPEEVGGFPDSLLTGSPEELVKRSDVVVECSGDPLWAFDVVGQAVDADRPVVTMNTEFHITCGSYFVGRGIVTEAAGDQPGCLAELHREAVAMGFQPIAYGNMKGFLNPDPTPEEMRYWGSRQGISLPMVTAFTDGTKVQAEQILVGNHFGATIVTEGMLGAPVGDQDEATKVLVEAYEKVGEPVTEFVVSPNLPHGVFVVATHDPEQAAALAYYKLGPGPYYTLVRPNIFVHLEILKTVRRALEGEVLLDNGAHPRLSLAATAKRPVPAGSKVGSAIGSFDFRGLAVKIADRPDHVPIGLLKNAVITRDLDRGDVVTWDDVELPPSGAKEAWNRIREGATTRAEA
jgi:predicted homoserine dehydrogenase-like protein